MNQADAIRPKTTHVLKLMEQYVHPILERRMTYQVRFGDRGFQDGDYIRFYVVDYNGEDAGADVRDSPFSYCDRDEVNLIQSQLYQVSCVMSFPFLEPGYVVFTINPARKGQQPS